MNQLIRIVFLLLSILLPNTVWTQTTKADSLETLLKAHKTDDTVKINILVGVAQLVYEKDSSKAHSYLYEAIDLCDKLDYRKRKSDSFFVLARSLSFHESDKKALGYYLKALKFAKEAKNQQAVYRCLNACGIAYTTLGHIKEAKECYLQAIKIVETLDNPSSLASVLGNLSIIFTGEGDYEKALEGYRRVLEIAEETNDYRLRSLALNNIGEINKYQGNYLKALEYYHQSLKMSEEEKDERSMPVRILNIGSIHTLQGNYKQALEYVRRALEIAEKLNNKRQILLCIEEMGNIYLQENKPEALGFLQKALTIAEELSHQTPILNLTDKIGDFYCARGDYHKALENYQRALKLSEKLNRKRIISKTYIKISGLYLLQDKYDEALKYSRKGLAIADELKLLGTRKDAHLQLSEIYSATNDFRRAYHHHKKYKELNDSIFNEKNVKKLAELEYTYKFEKEKQEIELEQQKKDAVQRTVLLSLIAAFVLVSLFAVFVAHSLRLKHKTNQILSAQNDEIEKLNKEYKTINEELKVTNGALVETKAKVEKSEERLKLLIKNSNDILVLANREGEQFFVSEAAQKLTGYPVNELLGSIEEVIFPDDIEVVRQHWSRILANKEAADVVQYRHKHKEKGYVWFETVTQNFLDHPAIRSIVANVRDITERKKAEIALQESEAAKARLLNYEIERINNELETNQRSMAAATLKLLQNSEWDAKITERLTEIEKHTSAEGKQMINSLITDNKRVSFNSNWDEFEILFEKVHRSFYEELNTRFPTLTANERKICAFLKLNMSNKDIAQITFQSDEALKKARLRLRQKLKINRQTNLVTFLQNI
ncbi:MAG: tetratricopeptide repeat protein [Prolixibacteraceae bacterium]|nr:tetratricopeptide repeat protein [Prolixibacteraceae bacterium]